jgi:hypothetical protein
VLHDAVSPLLDDGLGEVLRVRKALRDADLVVDASLLFVGERVFDADMDQTDDTDGVVESGMDETENPNHAGGIHTAANGSSHCSA